MEWILAAAAIGAIYYAAHKSASGSPPGAGSQSGSGATTSGSSSGTTPAPPVPAIAPGVYAPNTPGAVAVQLNVIGGDGFGQITAQPGGKTGTTLTVWYGPGTKVLFSAEVLGGAFAFGTAFDHFAGPGASTRDHAFAAVVSVPGYVDAVFATFGIVGA